MTGERPGCDGRRRGTEGAVFVEFLIAFLPVLTMFLCLCQLALLFAVKLAVDHAAVNAARAAAVVIGDDPKYYKGSVEPVHQVQKNGARHKAIEQAAIVSLGAFIADGTIMGVDVLFPAPNDLGGKDRSNATFAPMDKSNIDKVRVRVEAKVLCKIGLANRIACGGLLALLGIPTRTVRAEAVYPYQGASYTYP